MEIKKAGIDEVGIIKNLAEEIWPICYSSIISAEQIKYMLNLFYTEEALITQIKNGHQFIIAWENNNPIGFASFALKENASSIYKLHKLYVLTTLHTKGVGTALLTYVCNACKANGGNTLQLNVNKYNTAIEFYKKKNFCIIHEEVIAIGNGYVMDDYVMSLVLK